MSNPNHNSNETFRLLNGTESDSPSDIPEFSAPRRKVKVKRKFRPSNSLIKNTSKTSCTIWVTVKWLGIFTVVVFFMVIGWFLYSLYDKILILTQRLQDLESGTKKNPEEFHVIHTRLNLLDGNSTANRDSIFKMTDSLSNLSNDVEKLRKVSESIRKSIADAPQIETLPYTVQSLEQNVASLGSKITNLETTYRELKDITNNRNKDIQNTINGLQKSVEEISNRSQPFTDAQFLQEQTNHLKTMFQNINQTVNDSFNMAFNNIRYLQGNFSHVHNLSHELRERIKELEKKVIILDDISLQVNDLVQKDLNETIDNIMSGISNNTDFSNNNNNNLTVKHALAYIDSLYQLYQGLLINQTQYNKLQSMNIEAILTKQDLHSEQIKNITLQLKKLLQYMNQLKNEQTLTSDNISELSQELKSIRASLRLSTETASVIEYEDGNITTATPSKTNSSFLVTNINNSSHIVEGKSVSP